MSIQQVCAGRVVSACLTHSKQSCPTSPEAELIKAKNASFSSRGKQQLGDSMKINVSQFCQRHPQSVRRFCT